MTATHPLDSIETAIRDRLAARQGELVEQLAELVAIPSGQGHVPGLDRMRELLVARLEALGATTTIEAGDERPHWLLGASDATPPPTAICSRPLEGRGPRILIAGHLDTVHDPEDDFISLTHEADGISRGPGAADMKGGLLVAIAALEALDAEGIECHWSYVLNSDEETGTFCSERHLEDAAREHDVGLVIEPALPDGSLVVERMGSGQFMIEVDGLGAHVGREFERGISAVKTLAEVMTQVLDLADISSGKIVNIGPLKGGGATNAVPEHAACWGNMRFADPEAQASLADQFDAIEARWTTDELGRPLPEDHLPRVRIHRTFNRPAKPQTEDVTAIAMAARAVAEALGGEMPFGKTGGVCDANVLQSVGLPCVDTLGIRGGNLHRRDEYVEIESLWERAALFAILMKRIAMGETDLELG
ncbi:MAG: M20/M25/M40 family metallo-hydrolase [Phycisphaerales bacterium]|jgi:glutamate carboxypeptidase|nr:M20/M25/M40 family metallo-hydrolase [Phycisphaerales bacterium]